MKAYTTLITLSIIAFSSCITAESECPKGVKETIIIPNEEDCTSYWMCINSFLVQGLCSTGKLFDVQKLACVASENAICAVDIPTTEIPSSTNNPLPTTEEDVTATPSTEKYPVYCPPQIGPNDNYLIANPTDCNSYYHCVYGAPYLQFCPPNLQFNDKIKACDWPENVQCHIQNYK